MKEKDIRERIHIFLRDTVRYVVVPASMGIGLALVGCNDSALNANQDGSADSSTVQPGAGGMVALYMAPMGGASASGGVAQTGGVIATGGTTHPVATGGIEVYSAPMPSGGANGSGGATGTGENTRPNATGGMLTKYSAPMLGGAIGSGGATGTGGLTGVYPAYMGSFPVQGGRTGTGGVPATGGLTGGEKYSAPLPSGGTTASGGVSATGGTTHPISIGGMVTDYSAPMLGGGTTASGGVTARGGMMAIPLYYAILPDPAGQTGTGGVALRYEAPMPDEK